MIKICGFPVSNYFNKTRLVLLEKGIAHEQDLTIAPSQSPEILARSPMGKIPFLETEHGVLCESQIIAEYLEDRFPEKPLYPADPFARAKVREMIQVLELHVELAVRRVLGALFGATVSDETKNETRREVQKGLRAFTQLAKFGPYLAGSEFSMADCVAAVHFPMISLVSRMALGEDVLASVPQMGDYMKLIGERPAVQQIWAERDAAFQQMMAARAAKSAS